MLRIAVAPMTDLISTRNGNSTALVVALRLQHDDVAPIGAGLSLTVIIIRIRIRTGPLKVNAIAVARVKTIRHEIVLDARIRLHDIPALAANIQIVNRLAVDIVGSTTHGERVRSILKRSTELIRIDRETKAEIFIVARHGRRRGKLVEEFDDGILLENVAASVGVHRLETEARRDVHVRVILSLHLVHCRVGGPGVVVAARDVVANAKDAVFVFHVVWYRPVEHERKTAVRVAEVIVARVLRLLAYRLG